MSNPLLLTELNQFVEDEILLRMAQVTVEHLHSGSPTEIGERRQRLQQPERRAEEFEAIWNAHIEPAGEKSLNRGRASSAGLTVRMAYQGVVANHLLRLFAEGGIWWQRAEEIVAEKVA